jgi:hypothetical protein
MTENQTTPPDVTIFEGDQGPDYVRWIERHPTRTVLETDWCQSCQG